METNPRILYVDDSPLDRDLIVDALENSEFDEFRLTIASSRQDFENELAPGKFDLILSDFNILGFDGLQVVDLVYKVDPNLPVIIVTGTGSEEIAVEAMKRGVKDYVIKTASHIQRLPQTIRSVLKRLSLENEINFANIELRHREELFRTLAKVSPVGIFRADAGGHIIYVNEKLLLITGVASEQEFIAEWEKTIHPDDRQHVLDLWRACLQEKIFYKAQYRLIQKNGTILWVIAEANPIFETNEIVTGYVGTITNITELKQAEETLILRAHQLDQLNNELKRMYRAATTLISSLPLNLPELAKTVVNTVVKEFRKSNCSLYLIDQEANQITCLARAGFSSDQFADIRLTLDGPGIIPKAFRSQQLINIPDVLTSPDYVAGWIKARSELAVPLKVFDRVSGVLDLESETPGDFSADDERLIKVFADQAAILLENARLTHETKIQMDRLHSLQTIDAAINASLDLRVTARILVEHIISQLKVDATDLLLFDPISQSLNYVSGLGFKTGALRNSNLQLGQGLAGQAALERQTIHIENLNEQEGLFNNSASLMAEQFVEYYGIPLIAKGNVDGVLEIFNRKKLTTDASWENYLSTLASQAALAIENIRMFQSLQQSNNELTLAYDANIDGWSRSLDMRDKETEGHTLRATKISVELAKIVGISEKELVFIRWGAMLHDIGKMGVPDRILLKPGSLTEEEWNVMREHPNYARDLLSPIAYLKNAIDIPYCHHEKWDGSGYPRGLKGEEIPLAARLFAIVDVWDALRSDRYYRKAWPEGEVTQYIRDQAGKHFDPWIVEKFLKSHLFPEKPGGGPAILCISGDVVNCDSMASSLREQYDVYIAHSGEEATDHVKKVKPAVILVDFQMKGLDCFELLETLHANNPKGIAILVSDHSDVSVLTKALNLGYIRGILAKPLNIVSLRKKLDDILMSSHASSVQN